MFEYPKTNYIDNLTIASFGHEFFFVEGGGFVVQLVAAKVIPQHMFFFT